ncbi:hypothetical protein GFL86_28265 [Rhizobium laguerreae]|nr:hypothetical protein [Rhizobium laguerreae]
MRKPSLKRVAIFQIRSSRFRSLFFTHVVVAKPRHTFARHALGVPLGPMNGNFRTFFSFFRNEYP